jgi:hypothetical protein
VLHCSLFAIPSPPSRILSSPPPSPPVAGRLHLHGANARRICILAPVLSPRAPLTTSSVLRGLLSWTSHLVCCQSILCAQSDVPRPGLAALGRRRGRQNAPRGTGLRAPIACTNTWPTTTPLTHHRASARSSRQLPSPSTPPPTPIPQHHRAAADQHGPLFARHSRVKVLRSYFRPWRTQRSQGPGALRQSVSPASTYMSISYPCPLSITTTLFICRDAELTLNSSRLGIHTHIQTLDRHTAPTRSHTTRPSRTRTRINRRCSAHCHNISTLAGWRPCLTHQSRHRSIRTGAPCSRHPQTIPEGPQ